jgi:hypothetical protein
MSRRSEHLIGYVSFDQDMFTGGSETAATTLQWTMAVLMRNLRVMKKVQDEI